MDEASEPLLSPRNLRRSLLRALLAGVASVPFVGAFAVCAWAFVPATLFETACLARIRTRRGTLAAGLATFVLSFVLLVAAYFQCVYAAGAIRAGSFDGGLQAARDELTRWIVVQDFFHWSPSSNPCVWVFFCAQSAAIGSACALPMKTTGELHSCWAILLPALVLVVPVADWMLWGSIHGLDVRGLAIQSSLSSIYLGVVSVFTTLGALVAGGVADRIEQRLWPIR